MGFDRHWHRSDRKRVWFGKIMDFSLPLPAFIRKYFVIAKLTGHEKVLIVLALITNGTVSVKVDSTEVKKKWARTALKSQYSSTYVSRAVERGWLVPSSGNAYEVTKVGMDYLLEIQELGDSIIATQFKSELQLFETGQTHSFDKYLRKILMTAGAQVRIADSYVDGTIFDNLLDQIPKKVRVQLMFGKAYGSFEQRATRFSTEYPKFAHKQNLRFHDRLLIVDSVAYILGPSLKDAADKSPASVVRLNSRDSQLLIQFFDKIWKAA